MPRFGYKLMSEEHGPRPLVENAVAAEAAGFDFAAISDHFHPWLEAQGHAPFAWSVLGAIAQATTRLELSTGLTCPIIRYHPAIIAQAAATVSLLAEGRFTLAVGTGEALNEHVTGQRWPAVPERLDMLEEAIELMRLLWDGGVHTRTGKHFRLNHARLYDTPPQPIPVIVGASGPKSAALAARAGYGLMTTAPKPDLVQGWREAGGKGPVYGEVTLAWAPSEEAGRKLAHERFRFSALDWKVNPELPTVEGFEAATRTVRPEDLAESIPAGPDPDVHLKAIRQYLDAGFTHLALLCPGDDQQGFIAFAQKQLLPALRALPIEQAA
ncbi:MAG: TIGR03557 family F420-dependent LLM class oxidoreductase [Sphingomonadales bacterium]|nr:TIGR03557 family F420-dependent LLM class oxidoreductase [Sphingomonadales bacterium]